MGRWSVTDRLSERYELAEVVGHGAGSLVWRAEDVLLGREVAIKVVTDSADPTSRNALLRAGTLGAQVLHPNVVAVFDVVADPDEPFVVMELVNGESLGSRLARRGALPVEEAVRIATQVLDALTAIHGAGLVHCDLKPGNILLDEEGNAYLSDFGIAKCLADGAEGSPAAGQLVGTAQYLSPEQVTGEPATPASDLYAVGLVLYEMIAGRPPFVGTTPLALAVAHRDAPIPSLRDRIGGVAPRIADVVDRALDKRPTARHADAAAMREALLDEPLSSLASTAVMPLPAPAPGGHPMAAPQVPAPHGLRVSVAAALGVAVVAAALGGWIGFQLQPTGDQPDSTAQALPTTSAAEPTTALSTPTAPPTTEAALAAAEGPSLGELTDQLAERPEVYGDKGLDLLKSLQEVQREAGTERRERAEKAIEQMAKWVEEGKLDPAVVQAVTTRLEQIAGG